jgi:hypothetical protein
MEKPKPRRKNYRNFANLDLIKHKDNWFVRFPNEREHIYFGEKNATELMRQVEGQQKTVNFTDLKGRVIAQWPSYDENLLQFASATARELLISEN